MTVVFLLKPEPIKVKPTTRHENKIHTSPSLEIVDREGKLLIALTLRKFSHMVDFRAILTKEADVDGVHRDRRVTTDGDLTGTSFTEVHVLKFYCNIIANIGDMLFANREGVTGNRIIFYRIELAICFF